jgi:hypothetical protein
MMDRDSSNTASIAGHDPGDQFGQPALGGLVFLLEGRNLMS